MKGITLIGMPAVGKATVGRVLAKKLAWSVYDIDDIMAEKEGRSPGETTKLKGRNYTIKLESQSVAELDLRDSVLATPGSIIYATDCHKQLRDQTHIVWLDVALAVIKERLAYDPSNTRGVIGLEDGGLEKLFEERKPLYEKLAHVKINADKKNPEAICEEIIAKLNYQ